MKKAIIIGSQGQDGTILSDLLKKKGYDIMGIDRSRTHLNNKDVKAVDILSLKDMENTIKTFKPDEVYHLAAYHHASEEESKEPYSEYLLSHDINTRSLVIIMEAVRKLHPKTKIFYASSSHIFNPEKSDRQTEKTALEPRHLYGITKAESTFLIRHYRKEHKLFVIAGIFYNHNSIYRADNFLLMKIIKTVVEIKKGIRNELVLGDLSAKVDLGYAPDYMEAAHHVMQLEKADDYIISSGNIHSVREIVDIVFKKLGLKVQDYVKEDSTLIKRKLKPLFGDPSKIHSRGWHPKTSFEKMIDILLAYQMEKVKRK